MLRVIISRLSPSSLLLLIASAAMPLAFSAPTWSFISEMRGDTMTAIPSIANADIWKHSDLPPPVGISTSESPRPMV